MENKRAESILKFLYYIIGIQIAIFGFIISKLINIDYSIHNYLLVAALFPLAICIVISLFFILIYVFRPQDERLVSKKFIKKSRRLVGLTGALIGLILGLIITWILYYKEYLSI